MEREFKGVWIPEKIWRSSDLTVAEKIKWAEKEYGVKMGGEKQ
jgi:hypothetical protein